MCVVRYVGCVVCVCLWCYHVLFEICCVGVVCVVYCDRCVYIGWIVMCALRVMLSLCILYMLHVSRVVYMCCV